MIKIIMRNIFPFLILLFLPFFCVAQKTISTDVLIVGASASGVSAAIQVARLGVKVILIEETTWLGGMITAAGVSAFDGNHNMPSGIFGEFRNHLYKVYGGSKAVETGWVSNTLFEPHVGDSIFKAMVAREKNISVWYNTTFYKTIKKGTTIKGVEIINSYGVRNKFIAKQTIDATELGIVMYEAGAASDVGMESKKITGEVAGVDIANNIVQDMTYVAILKDYGTNTDKTITKPPNYDPMEFDGCCKEFCSSPEKLASNVTAKQLIEYGKLPNNKYMINWPGKGNDIYINYFDKTISQKEYVQKAKEKTIRFLYFIQTQLGYKNLDLADDEFPTADKLPLIPYYRESRRLKGLARLQLQHISNPFNEFQPLYRTGIAVGDYPIDHHHRENTSVPKELGFIPVPSYNIPIGSLIPQKINGLIVAEKSISVSNIVNGTTRLQPVMLLIGQAAGALAATCVLQNKSAQQINIRDVQQQLLKSKAYIMPYFDVKPTHPHWEAIQKIGATGILRGVGEPYKWANRTWFYPDSVVTMNYVEEAICFYYNQYPDCFAFNDYTIASVYKMINYLARQNKSRSRYIINEASWTKMGLSNYNINRKITRVELAVVLCETIKPFEYKNVKHNGKLIN